eukprot:TRINITY_DN2494_c0_g1_i1.p1 TRINITY_DN2494_c0_g1~~TRINITY_DN2494_c0_g1_i1.p1  ORF type:complete len:117 (+),score=17.52 TRINITY_DN2494_c0_g1_i1:127-477(+)
MTTVNSKSIAFMDDLVTEYLVFRGFVGTYRAFENEKKTDKLKGVRFLHHTTPYPPPFPPSLPSHSPPSLSSSIKWRRLSTLSLSTSKTLTIQALSGSGNTSTLASSRVSRETTPKR